MRRIISINSPSEALSDQPFLPQEELKREIATQRSKEQKLEATRAREKKEYQEEERRKRQELLAAFEEERKQQENKK